MSFTDIDRKRVRLSLTTLAKTASRIHEGRPRLDVVNARDSMILGWLLSVTEDESLYAAAELPALLATVRDWIAETDTPGGES